MHSLIDSAFDKIDNCDFIGAADDLLAAAKDLSNSELDGHLVVADKIAQLSDRLRSRSEKITTTDRLDKRFISAIADIEKCQSDIDEAISKIFEYFRSFERISGGSPRANIRRQDDVYDVDQYVFIEDVYRKYLSNEPIKGVTWSDFLGKLSGQISFYKRLRPDHEPYFFKILDRKSHVKKGSYVEFLELKGKAEEKSKLIEFISIRLVDLSDLVDEKERVHMDRVFNSDTSFDVRKELEDILNSSSGKVGVL